MTSPTQKTEREEALEEAIDLLIDCAVYREQAESPYKSGAIQALDEARGELKALFLSSSKAEREMQMRAVMVAEYHASAARIAMQGDCTGAEALRMKEMIANTISREIAALSPKEVGK